MDVCLGVPLDDVSSDRISSFDLLNTWLFALPRLIVRSRACSSMSRTNGFHSKAYELSGLFVQERKPRFL